MTSKFYENFLAACAKNHIKPTPLVKEIGLSSGNITRWKQGVDVTSEILLKIAQRLNVSVDYLLTGENIAKFDENSPEETQSPPDRLAGAFVISEFENDMLRMFRAITPEQQNAVYAVVSSFHSQMIQEKRMEKLSS